MKASKDILKYNRQVIMTGYIALEGTELLAGQFKEKIDERYPAWLTREASYFGKGKDEADFEKAREILSEHILAMGSTLGEDAFLTEVKKGGFLTGLYELSTMCGTGFELDLRSVPIRQETVEICELLEVNPYHLYGGKCLIAIVPEGGSALEKLKAAGISAHLTGHTTDKKAHILFNDGTESHLNRPEPDELERLGLLRD